MAGTNEFLPFGLADGADVITQSAYSALAARTAGFSTGTAVSGQLNKVWRQSAFVASAIAQIIANNNVNAPDDGNQSTFVTNLLAALFASPAMTGSPTAPTQTAADNSTNLATTAFIATALASYTTTAALTTLLAAKAPLASPILTGTPTAPTAAVGTNTNQLATMAALINALGSYLTTSAAAATYLTPAQGDTRYATPASVTTVATAAATAQTTANTAVTHAARAWANFDGTQTGTFAPRDGFNVSSITRNGAGDYTVNFTNNMANTNYAFLGTASSDSADSINSFVFQKGNVAPTVGGRRFTVANASGTHVDMPYVSIVVFGN